MNGRTLESSSDEDDTYTNSVARLKALKKQRLEKEKLAVSTCNEVQVATEIENNKVENNKIENVGNVIQREMRSTRYKTRCRNKNNTIIDKHVRSNEKQPPADDIDYGIEFVSMEPASISESCKDNAIELSSDDDACSEDDNYEMDIKVFWRSKRIDRLSIRRYDSFQKIFQHYADLEKVSLDEILIMRKDKIINPTDTPALLKLSIIDILDGGIVNPGTRMNTLTKNESKNNNDDNICNIKVQTANKKQSLTIPLKMDQQFKALFVICAEQLGMNERNLKYYFDGEQINPTDTPESLDLEGEACIDLHILST